MSMLFSLFQNVTFGQIVVGLCTYSLLRIVLFYIDRYKLYKSFKELGIPGPEPSLWDGSQSEFYSYPFWQTLNVKWHKKYGKTFGYFAGNQPILMTTDLELLQKIFLENPDVFNARTKLFMKIPPVTDSILFEEANNWKIVRKLLTPAFSRYRVKGEESTRFVDDTVAKMTEYIENKFQLQKKKSNSSDDPETITLDIMQLMKSTALHLISSMALHLDGVNIGENDPTVSKFDKFFDIMGCDGVFNPIKWAIRWPIIAKILGGIGSITTQGTLGLIIGRLNEVIESMKKIDSNNNLIEDNEQINRKQSSVLYSLVQLLKNNQLSHSKVLGNAFAVLIAGYETTSNTLTFILYTLSKHQNVQQKLRDEISREGIDSKYLLQVINETLRLYPVVTTFTQRVASRNIKLADVQIKRDFIVTYNAWLLHHDEKLWPEPMKYDPDRFDDSKKYHPCAFAPFGLGNRLCLGYQLAMFEIKCIMTELLTRYQWELISPTELKLKTSAFALAIPAENIYLKFSRL